MRLHNDPPYSEHKKVHDQFAGSVLKPQTRFKSGTVGLTTNVFNFLKGWLINHIKGTDKQYSPYLRSRGVA